MIEFPYGIADFHSIRRDRMVYVDRTAHIREMERLGRVLVFLRPRRFGKSLWLRTLATYYDLRYVDDFEEIFGGLAVHRQPTPLANRYFVLQWNFSRVTSRGDVEAIAESLRGHVVSRAKSFMSDYRDHLKDPVETGGSPESVLDSLLSAVRQTPYRLYLLIDEYDNFVNELMAKDIKTYRALFDAGGPFKELMKSVKDSTEGLGLERVFVTGVSPVALNDLTSGFNTAEDVSLKAPLAGLCGFYEEDLRRLFQLVAEERQMSPREVETMIDMMRVWYNGYRFNEDVDDVVYNPTNALFFLKAFYLDGKPPRALHDANLCTDQGKLAFLAHTAAGSGVIEELTEGSGEIEIPQLLGSFSLDDLTARLTRDPDAVASFLYYMGLLTLSDTPGRLRVPNLVVRKLFLDRLLEVFLPDLADSSEARRVAMRFFQDGDLEPLLAFFEEKLLPVLSNRDQGAPPRQGVGGGSGVNEMVLKALFLSILFDDQRFVVHSELEVDRGYADLCLLVRPETKRPGAFDLLFEFKLVRRKKLKQSGEALRAMDEMALRRLPAVAKAFEEARGQTERYRTALVKQRGTGSELRSYVVVAVGLERVLGEEVTS
jgi:hypothetical protein